MIIYPWRWIGLIVSCNSMGMSVEAEACGMLHFSKCPEHTIDEPSRYQLFYAGQDPFSGGNSHAENENPSF